MKKIMTLTKREEAAGHAPCSVVGAGLPLQKCWDFLLVCLTGIMLL